MVKKNLVTKNISFLFLCFCLFGCVTNQADFEQPEPVANQPTPEKVAEKEIAVALKRQVKDVDMKSKLDDATLKKRVVILPFLDESDTRSEATRIKAKEAFTNELNKTGSIIALDSSQIKNDPKKYIKDSDYNLAQLAKDSQNDGVSSLLEGKVLDLRLKQNINAEKKYQQAIFEAVVRVRIVSVRSGKEIFNTVKTVTIEDENTKLSERVSPESFFAKNSDLVTVLLKDAFLDFTQQITEAMTQVVWEGRIAALKADKIYLNVGRISGVQVGDLLKVVEDGSEVYDPEIGYHIGKVAGQAKGTLEIIGFFGHDGAISVIHSGAGFKENDRVELYQ